MNPYLMASLQPQIDEARRQAEIQRVQDAGRLTQAGAFGGSRQAIMESEGLTATCLQNLAGLPVTGYASAYDRAMQQFNTQQDREMGAQTAANTYGLAGTYQAGRAWRYRARDRAGGYRRRPHAVRRRARLPLQAGAVHAVAAAKPTGRGAVYSYMQPSQLSSLLSGAGGIMELFNKLFPSSNSHLLAQLLKGALRWLLTKKFRAK
jgi:hypothetical protein